MKRRLPVLSALAALLAATAAAPAPHAHSADSAPAAAGRLRSALDTVPERGVLRVCTTGDYPPFTRRDSRTGGYRGIDIEMARKLAKSLDAKPSFVATSWARLTGDLRAGRCDIAMGGVSVTLDRARGTYFSEPTRRDGKTPIVRCADRDKYRTLKQIDKPGTTVVVNKGGTNEKFARAHIKHAALRVHPDNTTVFDEITAHRADVMMTDASETRYQARLHPGKLCSVHPDKPFDFAEKAYALPRGDRDFKEYVDQFVHLAEHDGTYAKYEKEWLG